MKQGFQAAKLRLNPGFAKGQLLRKLWQGFGLFQGLKISHSGSQKGLLQNIEAEDFEKIFAGMFGLKKSRTTFAHPNGTPLG
jgi:hypothetical protein